VGHEVGNRNMKCFHVCVAGFLLHRSKGNGAGESSSWISPAMVMEGRQWREEAEARSPSVAGGGTNGRMVVPVVVSDHGRVAGLQDVLDGGRCGRDRRWHAQRKSQSMALHVMANRGSTTIRDERDGGNDYGLQM